MIWILIVLISMASFVLLNVLIENENPIGAIILGMTSYVICVILAVAFAP